MAVRDRASRTAHRYRQMILKRAFSHSVAICGLPLLSGIRVSLAFVLLVPVAASRSLHPGRSARWADLPSHLNEL